MSFTESGHWMKMFASIIYLKALCSCWLPPSIYFTPSLTLLLCLWLSVSPSLCVCLPKYPPPSPFLAVSLHLSLPPLRPSCGGAVSCARPQLKAGSPKGDAEHWGRDRSRDRRFPPQWCCNIAQGLLGRASRASADTQTLSCSSEDWRCWLAHAQILVILINACLGKILLTSAL